MALGKIIVLSAPSGCGKSTIIKSILETHKIELSFSVSATNRDPRPGEKNGISYYFLTTEEFQNSVKNGEFIEWEEVYPGRYYGTLRREVDKLIEDGKNVILDIDVKGAVNVKKIYGDNALTIFVQPPSIDELRKRLEGRGSDSKEVIDTRIGRAEYELSFANKFDVSIVNDILDDAVIQTVNTICNFINK